MRHPFLDLLNHGISNIFLDNQSGASTAYLNMETKAIYVTRSAKTYHLLKILDTEILVPVWSLLYAVVKSDLPYRSRVTHIKALAPEK